MPCRPPSVGSLQWVDGTSQSLTLATSKEQGLGAPLWPAAPTAPHRILPLERSLQSGD